MALRSTASYRDRLRESVHENEVTCYHKFTSNPGTTPLGSPALVLGTSLRDAIAKSKKRSSAYGLTNVYARSVESKLNKYSSLSNMRGHL